MDWDKVNVGLDQEAFKAAQAAGDTGFHVPWWVILIVIIAGLILAIGAVKKAKDGGDGDSGGEDKK